MIPFITIGAVLWIMLAFWPASLAKKKGYSFLLLLILSWGVSFIITLIAVVLLEDKTTGDQELSSGN